MAFDPGLIAGDVVDNDQLQNIFQCSSQGGMRRSLKTNTLVLISNHVKSIYDDKWDDQGIMHYTGMGAEGNQSLDFAQNKTLAESNINDVGVFLFEVYKPKEYTYIGQVELANKPYQGQQTDQNGQSRQVWLFPLKLISPNQTVAIPKVLIEENEQQKLAKIRKLSDQKLEEQAKSFGGKAGIVTVQNRQYTRNLYVAEFAKRRAQGICQLCLQPAPFNDEFGKPYLETHHIVWLSREGEDSVSNTVALCPNCHRKMHVLDRLEDRDKLNKLVADI